jgi:hypothetical protein
MRVQSPAGPCCGGARGEAVCGARVTDQDGPSFPEILRFLPEVIAKDFFMTNGLRANSTRTLHRKRSLRDHGRSSCQHAPSLTQNAYSQIKPTDPETMRGTQATSVVYSQRGFNLA